MLKIIVVAAGLAAVSPGAEAGSAQGQGRPNILLIVADDLGFSDLGAFGGEIATPNLDRLAFDGVRLTGLHTAPTCSPTRAMLVTGNDHHEVGLGSMAELTTPEQLGQPGYEGYLTRRAATVAERLRAGGYRTYMAGKWHLGLEEDQSPAARGFDRSFALLQGVHNHYGIDQNAAWRAAGVNARYREDGREATYPEGAYSADFFADRLAGYLEEDRRDRRPFFAYLTFTQPHWPLQAPEETVAHYRGRYDDGPEALRLERLQRQRRLGLIDRGTEPFEPVGLSDWPNLPAAQRAIEARKMEVYAAMVERLDQGVGRVIGKLRSLGELQNTVIIFLADNGPEASRIAAPGVRDPALLAALNIDNGLGNIGRANSWLTYGPEWAQAASAPSRLFKGFTTEGGTRVVAFVSGRGVRGFGRISDAFLHVTDVTPTILELAQVEPKPQLPGPAGPGAGGAVLGRPPARARSSGPRARGDRRLGAVLPPRHSPGRLEGGLAARQSPDPLPDLRQRTRAVGAVRPAARPRRDHGPRRSASPAAAAAGARLGGLCGSHRRRAAAGCGRADRGKRRPLGSTSRSPPPDGRELAVRRPGGAGRRGGGGGGGWGRAAAGRARPASRRAMAAPGISVRSCR